VRTLRDLGVALDTVGRLLAGRLRAAGTPELPADPTPTQLDAWLELAADEGFQRTTGEHCR
jgi:hypothetical protein